MLIPAGGNLQAALDAAAPGDVLELEAGAVYVGNFTIRGSGVRVMGSADIRTPNSLPALRTIGRAAGWAFHGVSFVAGASTGDIVQLGDGTNADPGLVPTGFVFENCTIQAETTAKRGLQLNAADVTLRRSTITGVKLAGQESQAICGWNGPGPFVIEDCAIHAGSIGILFGGAAPAIPNLVPSDITIRRTLVTRPLEMRGQNWGVKNLLELKNARHVTVTGCVFEHNWPQAQAGWAIVFTVRANGNAPWSTIEDVLFESNIVRHSSMGFNILGTDDSAQTQTMRNVAIRNNLCHDIDHVAWGGNGAFMQIGGGPVDLQVVNNTILHTGNVIGVNGPPCPFFRFTGNIAKHNSYGIFGNAVGTGNPAIARYFPNGAITGNALAGGSVSVYPSGNWFPAVSVLMAEFEDVTEQNYRLVSTLLAGLGCDQDAIEAAQRPPATPPPPPVPTLEETILDLADAARASSVWYGGHWSPQDAAFDAVGKYRDALVAALKL